VHFENLGGHPDHHEDDAAHADIENELMPQVLVTKAPDQDTPLFLVAMALLLTERQSTQPPHYIIADDRGVYLQPSDLLPPSQGPPSYSA
jgi:hypothetical protein